MQKKKIIKNVIGFVVFAFIAILVFNAVSWLFRGNTIESRRTVAGFDNEEKIDVVMFGGSDAQLYFQPLEAWNQAGFTSYNYATSGEKADMLKYYAEESRQTNDANLYVFNIRSLPMVEESFGDNVDAPLYIRNWSDSLSVFSPLRAFGVASYLSERGVSGEEALPYFIDIINYHENLNALSSPNQWAFFIGNPVKETYKGYEPGVLKNEVQPYEAPETMDEKGELTTRQLDVLNDLLNYCDENKLNALFVCAPYIIEEEDFALFNTAGEIIEERGYPFINFNLYYDEIGLDFETDMRDKNHLNPLGARKYTDYFIQYLTENYNLPDHRGEEEYAGWDEDYQTFAAERSAMEAETEKLVHDNKEAKEIGESLSSVQSFEEWSSLIQNTGFSLFIKKNRNFQKSAVDYGFMDFNERYEIDPQQDYYAGVWWRGENLLTTNDPSPAEIHDMFRDIVLAGGDNPSLNVNGVEYDEPDADFQVVVYDPHYRTVWDSATLSVDENGSILLHHNDIAS